MTIRVLVADDQAVVRDGVVLLLTSAADEDIAPAGGAVVSGTGTAGTDSGGMTADGKADA